ncbi:MAG TPA: MopE-related protein [Candidatus Limnocylindrales bacterium]|nr:MopE-related protein [Candidatus Limnocylindrales bacterium]
MRTLIGLVYVLCAAAVAASASAAPAYDHQLCYKIKTDKAFEAAQVNLDALRSEYGLQGCTLKPKAKHVCLPVRKSIVELSGGRPLAIAGGEASQTICYTVRCPAEELPPATFSDQFGSHQLSKFKPSLLCAPAIAGVPPSSSTTTTTLSATTTTVQAPTTTLCGQPETCNGVDDDCDTEVDEDLGTVTCGVGACFRSVSACTDGEPTVCQPGSPAAESCNNADDDCDGAVDENVTQSCASDCGPGTATCSAGIFGECVGRAPQEETCNGVDDDCDTEVDEDLGTVTCGVGACFRSVSACTDGEPTVCQPGSPAAESCNNADDDCDGAVDENVTQSCEGECGTGIATCSGGIFGECVCN